MGDDIDYEPYYTINAWQPTWAYSPVQQYYNSLCSPEMTEKQSEAYLNFIKAQQKREEKERDYEQFKEFTRILENSYYK